jgi:hypothetical protein
VADWLKLVLGCGYNAWESLSVRSGRKITTFFRMLSTLDLESTTSYQLYPPPPPPPPDIQTDLLNLNQTMVNVWCLFYIKMTDPPPLQWDFGLSFKTGSRLSFLLGMQNCQVWPWHLDTFWALLWHNVWKSANTMANTSHPVVKGPKSMESELAVFSRCYFPL